ncbi:MAG: restriction endonuclease subunit S [Candidatus Gastranaerophilales bacterium]|nr:restriction endonuclease subunit S [Candidatus Gastranaerophilales bacterium]
MEVRKRFLKELGFLPKDNTSGIYEKIYAKGGCSIRVDFNKKIIDYGELINCESKTTQNFSKEENWVVLECVNRLLEKGYKPQDIILEKVYPSGHGHTGRLDILVTKNLKAFLMIECKTFGKEFDNELNNTQKSGGQLLTYFQNDKNAEYLMLYTSRFNKDKIEYQNEIIKIEEYYRQAGNVVDTFERWNKQTYSNGIFDNWVNPYCYKNKPLTKADLLELTEENSGKIFHGFLSILRKHSVSDKPNAFNKIFNLFLAKIYDEKKRDNDTLDFQWLEDVDNPVEFQVRLYNLHKAGLYEFLKKEIEGISDDDFKYENEEELLEKKKKLLKFNKVFDIKDVIDDESFDDNFKVLKEVVQLLEKYQIRYPRKQQHLSDFFERLLTTGLKQEAGQFFTPPPITKFITKSLPIDKMLTESINQPVPKLPAVIDYAAGSGHFITEIMEAYQDCINEIDVAGFYPEAEKIVDKWRLDPYSWAGKYVYGIEKDYRLVKVAKVGCYFYGDGLAQVIHGDGLDSFEYSKSYIGLLSENTKIEDSKKATFSIVVSNPPYSVDAFKGDIKNCNVNEEFELYKYLTDRSSEIECLFVERTKQLLKDGGVAGIILPSSILTNGGIYTKTRELLLKYFEIVSITELGSNTFMATGTNTVVLFLRRRSNYDCVNLEKFVDKFLVNHIDVTINGIESPVSKFVSYVWEGLSFDDYLTLLEQKPNDKVKNHDLYKEYSQKITSKSDKEFWNKVIALEKEKIYYFILAYHQKIVIVKTGEKDAEKQFLGYEFSNRRGCEGIHAIQRGKSIDECTKLYDSKISDNPKKASTYIYKAFKNDFNFEIDESLKENISRVSLLDMMTFDRSVFEKVINTKVKKKVKIKSKWEVKTLKEVAQVEYGTRIVKKNSLGNKYSVYGGGGETFRTNSYNRSSCYIISRFGMSSQCVRRIEGKFFLNDSGLTLNSQNSQILLQDYLDNYLYLNQDIVYSCGRGVAQKNIDMEAFNSLKLPLPPLDIQQKIVDEIEEVEKRNFLQEQKILKIKENKLSPILNEILSSNVHLVSLDSILNFKRGPFGGSLKKEIFVDRGYKVYEQKHAINNDFSLGNYYITSEKYNEMKSFSLEPGDIIMSCSGTIGKFAVFPSNAEEGIINQALLRLRKKSDIISDKYLIICLNAISSEFEKNSHGAGLKNVASVAVLKEIKIYCPPVSHQQEIVAQIEELEKQIDEAQKIIDNSKFEKQKILEKYLN